MKKSSLIYADPNILLRYGIIQECEEEIEIRMMQDLIAENKSGQNIKLILWENIVMFKKKRNNKRKQK